LKRETETAYNFLQKHNIGYKKQTPLTLCISLWARCQIKGTKTLSALHRNSTSLALALT